MTEARPPAPPERAARARFASQHGVALVTAMLIVAIAATIAAYLASGMQLWLHQAEHLQTLSQSEALRRAAFDQAALLLGRDAADSERDDLSERWAHSPPALPAEGGTLRLAIEDAQGRFNLNNLVRAGAPSAPDIGVFRRLLALHGLDPSLVEAVLDWLDADDHTRPNGAEDLYYLNLPSPYRSANRPFVSVEELRQVRGFDAERLERLRAELIALPQPTAINVNTASARVLAALVPNLSLAAAEALVAQRQRHPFASPQAFLQALPAEAGRPQAAYTVASGYFLVRFGFERGRWQRSQLALLEREGAGRRVRLLWFAPDYLPAAAASPTASAEATR